MRIDGLDDCPRSEEHTSELQSRLHLVCRLLLEKKKIAVHVSAHPVYNLPSRQTPHRCTSSPTRRSSDLNCYGFMMACVMTNMSCFFFLIQPAPPNSPSLPPPALLPI